MATTTNLKLPELAAQGQQYLVGNEAFVALDSILSKLMSISMAAGDRTIVDATGSPGVAGQMESQALGYKLTGVLTADRVLEVPFTKFFIVWNTTTGAHTIAVDNGGATVEVEQGSAVLLYSDGTDVVAVAVPSIDAVPGLTTALGNKLSKNAFSFSGPVTNITVVDGQVTAAS